MELKIPITISEKEMQAVIEKVVTEMKSRGDLVYAVRCKDCKNYINGKCDTVLDGYTGGDDFYCAAGEPRGDDNDPELLEELI